ncbi:MAG TPA: alpha/beta hydrolase [Pseudolysinimonas sp.]|nr:alpha/beta hydrolase [Pseudolysinimonas sp.]
MGGMRAGRARRWLLVGVAAASIAGLLGGCASWFTAPRVSVTSHPTGEKVAANLKDFYSQVLTWKNCGRHMQCATATAPMNWADPSAARIKLALVRQPATGGDSKGSLLVNPGGPGGSGFDFIHDSVDFAVSTRLQREYDIIGFDPRGVGRSSAVSCFDDPKVMDQYAFGIIPGVEGSPEWIAASEKESADFAAGCLKYTGPLLQYVDTVSAARDLDLLRAILGDRKLNYLGFSYGTFLGATYAELYPKKTGHLVLDGALDPATSDDDVTLFQAEGFEKALRAYLADCLDRDNCPFRGTVDAAEQRIARILAKLEVQPIRADDGRQLGSGTMFTAIIVPLYNPDNWYALDQLFAEVQDHDATTAFVLADSYYERDADGTYTSNSTEAFMAINCLDYPPAVRTESPEAQAAELEKVAPVFGPLMAYGETGCPGWPFPSTRERGPITAAGSSDILVIGTTNDPATPYKWAQALAAELQNGHLITYKGEGHTAYNKSNSCVDNAVDDYFIDDVVPKSDPRC